MKGWFREDGDADFIRDHEADGAKNSEIQELKDSDASKESETA